MKLTLTQALADDKLAAFIDQAEADGIGPADGADLDRTIEAVIKRPRSEGRTSRFASRDGLRGK
jgi:hypothetical protein